MQREFEEFQFHVEEQKSPLVMGAPPHVGFVMISFGPRLIHPHPVIIPCALPL
jgi:hypothetical protein